MSPRRNVVPAAILSQIADAIEGMRFGCVQITVRDSRIVQIETIQKIRVDHDAHLTSGGSLPHPSCADQTAGGKRPLIGPNGHASGDVATRS